ncbi:MAG: hypothetical protein LBU62_09190 [Bacteroidales bacterium]|jgi:hypothetical protein|nr:hypothetical protein [Bacteroidales bacterium]
MLSTVIHRNLFSFLLLAGVFGVQGLAAQEPTESVHHLVEVEARIMKIMYELRISNNDSFAMQKHHEAEELFAEALRQPAAFLYPFDSLTMIGKLYSPDKKFRLINWNHSFLDGTQSHYGLIVIPSETTENTVIWLTDQSDSIEYPEKKELTSDQWFGALYYRIIPAKTALDGERYYTLLGVDLNTLDTKKKIVEVLAFGKNGTTVQFGAPIIEMNGWTKHRLIFEFSSQETMYLEYNKAKDRIEFDHLAPTEPYLFGQYAYYGPDMRQDGLKFAGKRWKHYKNISIKKIKKAPVPPAFQLGKSMQTDENELDGPEENE